MDSCWINAPKLFGFLVVFILAGCAGEVDKGVNLNSADAVIDRDRQVELIDLAQEWVETRDDRLAQQLQDEEELRFVENVLQSEQGETDDSEVDQFAPTLSTCSGYWGTYRFAGKAEYSWVSSSYSYYWSPNCYMAAPGDDCGTDHDDNMVSFWMGPDYTMTEASYRVDSDSWSTYWHLLYHGGASYRVYTSGSYGNAYVCLSNTLDASTLRFGRDY